MNTMLRRSTRTIRGLVLASTGLGVLAPAGCSTVEGLGDDIRSASVSTKEAIDDATGAPAVHDKGSVEGQGAGRER